MCHKTSGGKFQTLDAPSESRHLIKFLQDQRHSREGQQIDSTYE